MGEWLEEDRKGLDRQEGSLSFSVVKDMLSSRVWEIEMKGNSGWRRVVWLKETKHGTISCGDKDVLWEGMTEAESRFEGC